MSLLGALVAVLKKPEIVKEWARYGLIFLALALVGASGSWALASLSSEQAAAQPTPAPARPTLQPAPAIQAAIQGNAHCRCEITCHAADGRTFTRNNSPFPGYTQGLESERNRCQSSCNQWVGSSIQSWAEEENICGNLSCSGTSHVGNEPGNKWKNVAGASHHRTCCPPASNGQGCPPAVGTAITSVFRLVQIGPVTGNYNLIYSRFLNPALDTAFQTYTNYVATQVAGLHHIWVGYRIDDVTNPTSPVQIGWFAVKYTVGSTAGGVPSVSLINPQLQINHTYRVTRGLFFKNAQDQDLPNYGDPSCQLPTFTISLTVTLGRSGAPGAGSSPRPMARFSVEGQPDGQVAIEPESDADRELRLRIERETPRIERPNLRIEMLGRPAAAASPR